MWPQINIMVLNDPFHFDDIFDYKLDNANYTLHKNVKLTLSYLEPFKYKV